MEMNARILAASTTRKQGTRKTLFRPDALVVVNIKECHFKSESIVVAIVDWSLIEIITEGSISKKEKGG